MIHPYMIKILEKILNIGIDSSYPPYKTRAIRIYNATGIFVISAIIPQLIQQILTYYDPHNASFRPGLFMVISTVSLSLAINAFGLILNLFRLHLFAKVFSVNTQGTIILFWTLFNGHESQFQIYILSLLVIIFIIFDRNETIWLRVSLTWNVFMYLGAEYISKYIGGPLYEMPEIVKTNAIYINPGATASLILLGLYYNIRQANNAEIELEQEKDRSERLLLNVLPKEIAERLKKSPDIIADDISEATILFADIVNFTVISSKLPARQLVMMLNKIFTEFDRLAKELKLEKIKTIGDAYMVAGGIPHQIPNHAELVLEMARSMQSFMTSQYGNEESGLKLRIGIHTGHVVAGVIGNSKFSYDLWGDTVNTASRMESHGIPGKIHVSTDIYDKLKDKYAFESRGQIEVKGKGLMNTYLFQSDT